MQLSVSDFIAPLALLVSFGSALYTKRQMELARLSTRNALEHICPKIIRNTKLRYWRFENDKAISELSSMAGITVNENMYVRRI
jgi:hypothetical protein